MREISEGGNMPFPKEAINPKKEEIGVFLGG